MTEKQNLMNIEIKDLVEKVKELRAQGYRLVQIGCTKTDVLEINYSFDKDFNFVNLKVTISLIDAQISSVSSIYWSAFLYENEMSDLYGIKINNMAIDYKGNFYRTTVKFPFNPPQNTSGAEGGIAL